MTLIEDPNADARSLMYRAPCVCTGAANGIRCKHLWSVAQKFRAQNADAMRLGEKHRSCTLTDSFLFEFTSEEEPTYCDRYEPKKEPGLVAIGKRVSARLLGRKKGPGYVTYDQGFARFNPMTIKEIQKLREEFPDQPMWGSGKSPLMMTMDDIANGPQIGIVKPGEEAPPSGLSPETEKELDGIFGSGSGGIFNKDEK